MAGTQRTTAPGRKKWTISPRPTDDSTADTRPPEGELPRNLAVPFRGHITGGLCPGRKVVLVGFVDSCPDRFYVALTCGRGTSEEPPPDVALELCVRFKDQQVLRRACVSGSWGDTEKGVAFFPFIKAQPFKMEIRCEHGRFRVLVDGQKTFDFSHRLPSLRDVDTMWIKGSISITKLA